MMKIFQSLHSPPVRSHHVARQKKAVYAYYNILPNAQCHHMTITCVLIEHSFFQKLNFLLQICLTDENNDDTNCGDVDQGTWKLIDTKPPYSFTIQYRGGTCDGTQCT